MIKLAFNKIEKGDSYKEKVYRQIKDSIITNILEPGYQLNERDLSESLGISRTPVREAIQMLEHEGWVKTEPWKGTYVIEITEQDIMEVFKLREVLETMVIEELMNRIGDDNIKELENYVSVQTKYYKEHNIIEFTKTDKKFHFYLATLTGNKRLIQILDNLGEMVMALGIRAIRTEDRCKETIKEHNNIIIGLKNNDVSKAREAMKYHILRTKAVYLNKEE